MTTTSAQRKVNTFTVGDILVSSWGWEQTNVDFRMVTRITAATVRSVSIGSRVEDVHTAMSGTVVPDPSRRGDDEVTSRVLDRPGLLKAPHGLAYMRVWDGQPKAYSTWG
jgi:hypothetical protein